MKKIGLAILIFIFSFLIFKTPSFAATQHYFIDKQATAYVDNSPCVETNTFNLYWADFDPGLPAGQHYYACHIVDVSSTSTFLTSIRYPVLGSILNKPTMTTLDDGWYISSSTSGYGTYAEPCNRGGIHTDDLSHALDDFLINCWACDTYEECYNLTPTSPVCGDLTCTTGETCLTCPGDCGNCDSTGQLKTNQPVRCPVGGPCYASFTYDNNIFVGPADPVSVNQYTNAGSSACFNCAGALIGTSAVGGESATSTIQIQQSALQGAPGTFIMMIPNHATSERQLYAITVSKDGSSNLYLPYQFEVDWSSGGGAPLIWNPNGINGITISNSSTSTDYDFWGQLSWGKCSYSDNWFAGFMCDVWNVLGGIFTAVPKYIVGGIKNAAYWVALNLFPINIPAHIIQSFTDSLTADTPAGLEWLIPNDGQYYATIPPLMTGGNATTTILIFGSDAWEGNTGVEAFFAHVRSLSTILIYALFVLGLCSFAFKVFNEAKGNTGPAQTDPEHEYISLSQGPHGNGGFNDY